LYSILTLARLHSSPPRRPSELAGAGLNAEGLAGAELASADAMAAMWNSRAMGNVLVLGGIAGLLTSWNAFLIGGSRLPPIRKALDRKSTRLNSSHVKISYAVFC